MPRANDAVEAALFEYSELLSIVTDDRFKPRAYEKAARAVGGYPADLDGMELAEILAIPGVGKSIGEKVEEFLRTGSMAGLEELRTKIPPGVREMTAIAGLGPKKAMVLYRELGISDVEELRHALDAGQLAGLKGFGARSEENIRRGIQRLSQQSGRALISAAMDLAEYFLERLGAREDVQRIEYAGSLRRMAETIGDVDLLVASEDPEAVMEAFTGVGIVERVIAKGDKKTSVMTRKGLQVDLRVVPLEAWGAAMIYFTGSKAHNIRIREMAVRKGLKLNEYGLFRAKSGTLIVARTEEEVYAKLGLPWIPPTLREDRGEIEAALDGTLPDVLSQKQLRGDLHTHTKLTDGLATLEQMLDAASEMRLRVLRRHRPRAEPVHAADDRREDAGAAGAAPRAPGALPEDDAAPRLGAEHRRRGERRLGAGVPRGVRRLRRLRPLALHPAQGRDDAPDHPGDGEPVR